MLGSIDGLHTRTPPESDLGRGLANAIDAYEKEDLGLVLSIAGGGTEGSVSV
jgi:hypothetical protein